MSGSTGISVNPSQSITLEVEHLDMRNSWSVVVLLWYHNGSLVAPNNRITLNNDNRSLTITNFSMADSGIYKVQLQQLPYSEHCQNEILSLFGHYPAFKPVIFCVNMKAGCPEALPFQRVSIHSVYPDLQGTFHNFSIQAEGTVLSSNILKYSYLQWYSNGRRMPNTVLFSKSSVSLTTLQKQYPKHLSQELEVSTAAYDVSGRHEVLLAIDVNAYLQDFLQCTPGRLQGYSWILNRGYVDVGYHEGTIACTQAMQVSI